MGITAAVVGGAALGYQVYSGERSNRMQKESLRQQDQAQQQATMRAEQQRQSAEQAQNRASQRQPNVRGIMEGAMAQAQGGPTGTMLTGPMGVDPSALMLGRSTLLGS